MNKGIENKPPHVHKVISKGKLIGGSKSVESKVWINL